MMSCVFCQLIAGDFPAHVIYEDETVFAFMDINPVAMGHVLLVPKTHYETLDQMPADESGRLARMLPALVRGVKNATEAEGVNVLQNNGAVAGQQVGHVHYHIIPRVKGDDLKWNWPAKKVSPDELTELRARVAVAMNIDERKGL
ncbi:MAG: HIT family protein [Lentisphaeria bacterium]|nr:HIT family protein [Lentisphaeria bacterium]